MKNPLALFICIFFAHTASSQTPTLQKLEATLQKHLTGQRFLRGIYDLPCNSIGTIKLGDNGDIILTGKEKGCDLSFSVIDARITTEEFKVQVFRASPKINITFYIENNGPVFKVFNELKMLLGNGVIQPPKETKETVTVSPPGKMYTGLFNTYPLAVMESKVMEPGLYDASLKESETNSAVTKTAKKVGNVSGTAFLYAKDGIQVAELFFDGKGKLYYYNRNVDMEYLEAAGKALTEKGFVVKTITQTSGAIENTWRKPGHPYVFVLQYFPGKKKLGIVILDKDIYN